MSRKYKFQQQYMRGGSQYSNNLLVNNKCQQAVDVSKYVTPCQSLTFDPGFNQTGGEYNFIINPKTGRRVSIYGKIGKEILYKYLNVFFN